VLRVDFVRRKLQLITDDLGRLMQFRDTGYDELIGDPVRLAAVERLLERIILRAIDVNEHLIATLSEEEEEKSARLTYRDTFLRLVPIGVYDQGFAEQIARSAGLRNILVHEYNDVDHRIVHAAILQALEQYHTYVSAVNRFIDSRQN
jgi:uncharacterized protein YutE (UPF0331/DUF86 family)